jgi:hypothetical protein
MAITSTTTSSADQLAQIDTLKTYVEDYCSANNIDPAVYLSSLDGNTISDDLRNDPAFQAYWQLTYLQLTEIIDPSSINSQDGQVGEINFDAVYAAADQQTKDLITNLLQDDPELMAFALAQAGQTEDSDSLLSMFTAANTAAATSTTAGAVMGSNYLTDVPGTPSGMSPADTGGNAMGDDSDARALGDEYDLGGGYDWLIDTEEGVHSTESSIFDYLAEMDQQLVDLKGALSTGQITAEEFSSQAGDISTYRETMLGMLQQLESSLSTIFDMYSKMVEQATQMQMSTINNMKPA